MAAKEMLEKQVPRSRFFKNARSRAENIINNPEKLQELLNEADQKAKIKGKGLVGEAREFLAAAFRLLRAYATGQYRQTPWKTLMAVTAAVVYFVMPLDVIPDLILGLGFFDDAALIMWTFKSIRADMDRFAAWENGKRQAAGNTNTTYRPDAPESGHSSHGDA